MGSGSLLVMLAKHLPTGILDLAFRNRYTPPFSWLRPALERRLGDAPQGREILRGPLAGQRIAFDAVDSKVIWIGLHEPLVQEWILREVAEGDVAYDIGAHIGYFVLLMAKAVGAQGRVVAFEPDPVTYGFLEKTVSLNGLSDRVTLSGIALGHEAGKGDIVRGWQSGYTQVQPEAEGKVAITTLDQQVYEAGFPIPRFILIDTEGAEESILRGAHRILTEAGPKVIVEHHSRRDELVDLLKPYGYSASDIDESHTLLTKQ